MPPVVKNLLIINVLFFIATQTISSPFVLSGIPVGLTGILALWPVHSPFFRPYQLFTHMFVHANFMHILYNMLFGLWMFGRILENVWGPKRFLFFYLACGLGAAICHLAVQYFTQSEAPAVGASGAIMGLFAAFAYLFPNTKISLYFFIPIKAKWVVVGLIAIDLFYGVNGGDNVAHFAHLGGAVTGFIIVLIWNKTNRRTLY